MATHWLLYAAAMCVTWSAVGGREYCDREEFIAQCNASAVIVILSAEYGRMRKGRCVTSDSDLGCSSRAKVHFEGECSGVQTCTVSVSDLEVKVVTTCSNDLKQYLDVEYECVTAEVTGSCEAVSGPPQPWTLNSSIAEGYLSSDMRMRTGVGTSKCPWRIQALPGQQYDLTIHDYTLGAAIAKVYDYNTDTCPVLLHVQDDQEAYQSLSLCNTSVRKRHMYTSLGHDLQFYISVNHTVMRTEPRFMLQFNVFGCPHIPGIPNGWVIQDGSSATIGCNVTLEIWSVVCRDTGWYGKQPEECPEAAPTSGPTGGGKGGGVIGGSSPINIAIAVGIGVGAGIVAGLILLGLVLACRKCYLYSRKNQERGQQSDLSTIQIPSVPPYPAMGSPKEPMATTSKDPMATISKDTMAMQAMTPEEAAGYQYPMDYNTQVAMRRSMETQYQRGPHPYDVPGAHGHPNDMHLPKPPGEHIPRKGPPSEASEHLYNMADFDGEQRF